MNALGAAAIALLTAAVLVGCAAPTAGPALDQARTAVERARSAPRIRALAPAELDLAEIALENAGEAARAGAPPDQVEHLAYVAIQRAALAETRAAERVARSETRLLRRALGPALAAAPPEEQRERARRMQSDRAPEATSVGSEVASVGRGADELTIALAQLSFAGNEPTGETVGQIAAVAERQRREPERTVTIAADFDRLDPAARTTTERRIEVVRALFLAQGVAPARLVVRAGSAGPARAGTASVPVDPDETVP